jgi:hypothetical protein
MNPPFRVPGDELARMSDTEILSRFDYEREEDGSPKLARPGSGGPKPTHRYLHERLCFSLGVTEPEDVERLWREKQAKEPTKKAAPKRSPPKKRRGK